MSFTQYTGDGSHAGHRKRLILKLQSGTLLEHEYLEALLFNAVPRKNTNDLAHRLLAKFGSIPNLFRANMNELQSVEGVGESVAAYIYCIGVFCNQYYDEFQRDFQGSFEAEKFLPFVKRKYEKELKEVLDIYLLNAESNVYKYCRFDSGGVGHASIEPEKLTRFLLENGPSGVVIAHNHPFGEATPSDTDDEMTRTCQIICSAHNAMLCDHVIYAPNGVYSYYLDGKMQGISQTYSLSNLTRNKGERL